MLNTPLTCKCYITGHLSSYEDHCVKCSNPYSTKKKEKEIKKLFKA